MLFFISIQDWVQFEEVADIEEKALSAFFESGPSVSSSAATLPESLTKLPDVVVCPEASENEKGDVSKFKVSASFSAILLLNLLNCLLTYCCDVVKVILPQVFLCSVLQCSKTSRLSYFKFISAFKLVIIAQHQS